MVKILVVYYTRTGNTEKMASAVAEGAKQNKEAEVTLKKVEQTTIEDLLNADGIIIGSPTYYGLVAAKIKLLIDESVKIHGKLEGKVGAAFTTSGGTATGAETTLMSILQAMLVHGMIVQGCSEDKHYGAAAVGTPSKEEVEHAKDFGRRVADLTVKLKSKK